MATPTGKCGWNIDRTQYGPKACGWRSSLRTDHPTTDNGEVCGMHAGAVCSGQHAPAGSTYTVSPLATEA